MYSSAGPISFYFNWIPFSHLLLHLLLFFRSEVPAQNGSGSGGRRRGITQGTAWTLGAQEEEERSDFKHALKESMQYEKNRVVLLDTADITEQHNRSSFYLGTFCMC